MNNYILKLDIKNIIKDIIETKWMFFDSIHERNKWKNEMIRIESEFNINKSEISLRNYIFNEYDMNDIVSMDMSEFNGLSFNEFIILLKNVL